MHRYTLIKSFPALLLLGGCLEGLLNEGDGLVSISATEAVASATSTGEPPTPTTSAGSGVQTVTGDEDSTGPSTTSSGAEPGSSSGEAVNLPPKIELFDVKQDHLDEAGPADLQLIASDDVVKVRLMLDGEKLDDLTLADFPRTWDALSAKDNGDRIFKVVVEDAEGLTAEAEDKLSVLLPQSGAEKCIFPDPVDGAVISLISALTYTRKGEILAVGTRGPPGALRLTAWLLDPNTCKPIAGWPKSPENWSDDDGFTKLASFGAAVAVDEDGNLIVAGNFLVDNKPQGYVALLNSTGSLLWEKAGQVGDEITSVAAGTAQFGNRVLVGGARWTSDNPVLTDGAVWVYIADGKSVFIQPPYTLQAPFTPDEFDKDPENLRSEWVRALVLQPGTGNVLAVGERQFKPTNKLAVYRRAFSALVHPLGGVVGTPWTSSADASFVHDAVRSVAACGDGFLAGGWARDLPVDAEPQPKIFWLGNNGSAVEHRTEPQLASTELNGIACDREGKIVSAGVRSEGSPDAQVFTVTDAFGPRVTYETGVVGQDGASAVACDSRGFCGWGGYRTANAKPFAVVRVHHP